MKNARSLVSHCTVHSPPASGRRICTHKAIYNMWALSEAELGRTTEGASSSSVGEWGEGALQVFSVCE